MEFETITTDLKLWMTWKDLQKIFQTTEVEVVCAFYENRYKEGNPYCWTIEWTRK